MRIGFISTYPPIECGIATYTQYLTDALRAQGIDAYIVSHYGGNGKNVFTAFDYEDGDLAEKAFSMMARLTPDIVHIQHEFGLYGKHFGVSVIPLILQFRLRDIPVVTTLHTVYNEVQEQHRLILTSIIENSNAIIIHEAYQLEALRHYIKRKELLDKVHVIPHGAREIQMVENAKAKLEIPDTTKVILMIGYFRPSKRFERIVRLWPKIVEKHNKNDILLVMAGKVRGIECRDYRNMLFKEINTSPARDTIKVIRGQISQDSFDTIISASDVVILPYSISSQSGIVAHCLAFGKPIITSDTSAMNSLIEKTHAGLVSNTDQDYIDNIAKILENIALRKQLSANALRYVQDHISWSKISERHIKIYKALAEPSVLEINNIWMD
ncbi:MAG: glycosyltransferase [Thermodesulfobacteriota bacterium]|nr:glycosyltransferase [Thermodesulfobacteriota bacterium]